MADGQPEDQGPTVEELLAQRYQLDELLRPCSRVAGSDSDQVQDADAGADTGADTGGVHTVDCNEDPDEVYLRGDHGVKVLEVHPLGNGATL